MMINTDVVIAGTGVAGLFAALHLPRDKKIVMITKSDLESSDSFLAQGGICVLRDENDYESFMEDTLKAGHYENRKESVDIMIRDSQGVIAELLTYGVQFHKEKSADGEETLAYTREGGHSKARILYYEDITGKEITSRLLAAVKALPNVTLYEYTTMTDLIVENNTCRGIIAIQNDSKEEIIIRANDTILATGGIGGLYEHSTNFPHLTGDAITLAKKYDIALEHLDYVQIHPTTLYSDKPGRRFLISESLRGEGAVLLNSKMERFTDEIQPRDVVTKAIHEEMAREGSQHVWLSAVNIPAEEIHSHFPNIYEHCLSEGYDITKEPIPVVPAQHYFMGGIWVDSDSRTSMPNLYAVGETSCNGVHGANRLASNSLLESLVFAHRAAKAIQNKE
ncbi:MAG: L-aspartate oxidase [Peptococcaceae bacterium]|nr:L-aspartate oxidase [Peptococcaceae bacterium]